MLSYFPPFSVMAALAPLARLHPRARNLVGWWPFGEGGGSRLYDVARGNHGALTNMDAASDWVQGLYSGALAFDGTNDFADMGDVLNFERTDRFSVSLWYKSDVSDITANVELVTKKQDAGNLTGWRVGIRGGTAGDPLRFNLTNIGTTNDLGRNFVKPQNTAWHHVVVTYDGSSAAAGALAYIDGQVATPSLVADTLTASTLSTAPLNLAGINSSATAVFAGQIGDVRIWARTLSQADGYSVYRFPFLEWEWALQQIANADGKAPNSIASLISQYRRRRAA